MPTDVGSGLLVAKISDADGNDIGLAAARGASGVLRLGRTDFSFEERCRHGRHHHVDFSRTTSRVGHEEAAADAVTGDDREAVATLIGTSPEGGHGRARGSEKISKRGRQEHPLDRPKRMARLCSR